MKFVVLDEVDSMTKQAQISLDYIIQRSSNVFFCLICNYLNKIIDPLKNKLIVVNFYNTSNGSGELIDSLLQNEKKDVPKEVIEDLKFIYNHDLRSIINHIQAYDSTHDHVPLKRIRTLIENYSTAKLRKIIYLFDPLYVMNKIFWVLFTEYPLNEEYIDRAKELIFNHQNDNVFSGLDNFLKSIQI
jgi:DNA polymerase III delta prime subunit